MARNKLRVDVCLLFLERFRKAGIIAHVTVLVVSVLEPE